MRFFRTISRVLGVANTFQGIQNSSGVIPIDMNKNEFLNGYFVNGNKIKSLIQQKADTLCLELDPLARNVLKSISIEEDRSKSFADFVYRNISEFPDQFDPRQDSSWIRMVNRFFVLFYSSNKTEASALYQSLIVPSYPILADNRLETDEIYESFTEINNEAEDVKEFKLSKAFDKAVKKQFHLKLESLLKDEGSDFEAFKDFLWITRLSIKMDRLDFRFCYSFLHKVPFDKLKLMNFDTLPESEQVQDYIVALAKSVYEQLPLDEAKMCLAMVLPNIYDTLSENSSFNCVISEYVASQMVKIEVDDFLDRVRSATRTIGRNGFEHLTPYQQKILKIFAACGPHSTKNYRFLYFAARNFPVDPHITPNSQIPYWITFVFCFMIRFESLYPEVVESLELEGLGNDFLLNYFGDFVITPDSMELFSIFGFTEAVKLFASDFIKKQLKLVKKEVECEETVYEECDYEGCAGKQIANYVHDMKSRIKPAESSEFIENNFFESLQGRFAFDEQNSTAVSASSTKNYSHDQSVDAFYSQSEEFASNFDGPETRILKQVRAKKEDALFVKPEQEEEEDILIPREPEEADKFLWKTVHFANAKHRNTILHIILEDSKLQSLSPIFGSIIPSLLRNRKLSLINILIAKCKRIGWFESERFLLEIFKVDESVSLKTFKLILDNKDKFSKKFIPRLLCFAAISGNFKVIQMYLDSLVVPISTIEKMFEFAVMKDRIEIVEDLLDRFQSNPNFSFSEHIIIAVLAGQEMIVMLMLCSPNFQMSFLKPAILGAILSNHFDIVRLIVHNCPESQNHLDEILIDSIKTGQYQTATTLIQDFSFKAETIREAYLLAIQASKHELVHLLFDKNSEMFMKQEEVFVKAFEIIDMKQDKEMRNIVIVHSQRFLKARTDNASERVPVITYEV